MLEAKPAAFSFIDFKVPRFSYNVENQIDLNVKVGFLPNGKYNSSTGEFELTLNFFAKNVSNEVIFFELASVGLFKFNSAIKLNEIPSYFYKNSIGILYPYIRAFVGTLTLQANIKLLKLDLLNLSELEKPLIENTVEF